MVGEEAVSAPRKTCGQAGEDGMAWNHSPSQLDQEPEGREEMGMMPRFLAWGLVSGEILRYTNEKKSKFEGLGDLEFSLGYACVTSMYMLSTGNIGGNKTLFLTLPSCYSTGNIIMETDNNQGNKVIISHEISWFRFPPNRP